MVILSYDCLYLIAEFIDHPLDWYNFARASPITASITRRLKDKKQAEFKKKWIMILVGNSHKIIPRNPFFRAFS